MNMRLVRLFCCAVLIMSGWAAGANAMELKDYVSAMRKNPKVMRMCKVILSSPQKLRQHFEMKINSKFRHDSSKTNRYIARNMSILTEYANVILHGQKPHNIAKLKSVVTNRKMLGTARAFAAWMSYAKTGDVSIMYTLIKMQPSAIGIFRSIQDGAFPRILGQYLENVNVVLKVARFNTPSKGEKATYFPPDRMALLSRTRHSYKSAIEALCFQKSTTNQLARAAFNNFAQLTKPPSQLNAVKAMGLIHGPHAFIIKRALIDSLLQQGLLDDVQKILKHNPKLAPLVAREKAKLISHLKEKIKNLKNPGHTQNKAEVPQHSRRGSFQSGGQTASKVAGQESPSLVAAHPKYDFGKRTNSGFAKHTFVLTNKSNQPVHINKITTSCGCTVAKQPSSKTIKPGTKVKLPVTIDLSHKSGAVKEYVLVQTDDPNTPVLRLTITGTVVSN